MSARVKSNTRAKKRCHHVRAFEVTLIKREHPGEGDKRLRMALCAILKSFWYKFAASTLRGELLGAQDLNFSLC